MRHVRLALLLLVGVAPVTHAAPPAWNLEALARQGLTGLRKLPDYDQDGYGNLAWGTSYGMWALNALYEATGDVAYLRVQAGMVAQVLARRDSDLAAKHGPDRYQDTQRGDRVLQAWGTGGYTGGKHTCWAVHAGMLLYPMAEYVKLVRAGGSATASLRPQAEAFLPEIEAAIKEFDPEWRDGPLAGMGYYAFPGGGILPNNQMNAPGCALFILADLTGKAEYRDKAHKLAAFFRGKLAHVPQGDYYVWAYSQPPEAPPGSGEDISHASLNATFMYVAWEHGVAFDDTDMARLTRTVTVGMDLGGGQLAATLGGRAPNDGLTPQCGRWGFLARFDPAVEQIIHDYQQAHAGKPGALRGTTGALGYASLLRARKLRG